MKKNKKKKNKNKKAVILISARVSAEAQDYTERVFRMAAVAIADGYSYDNLIVIISEGLHQLQQVIAADSSINAVYVDKREGLQQLQQAIAADSSINAVYVDERDCSVSFDGQMMILKANPNRNKDIREFNAGIVGELAMIIQSNLMQDRYFQRGTAVTIVKVVALTFDFEQNKIIAKTLQTDSYGNSYGSSYVDVEINDSLERVRSEDE